MLSRSERNYAILKCLYFGILPSFTYEKNCHYARNGEGMGVSNYLGHLRINMLMAKSLVMRTEHPCTHEFHKMKVTKWLRFQHKD